MKHCSTSVKLQLCKNEHALEFCLQHHACEKQYCTALKNQFPDKRKNKGETNDWQQKNYQNLELEGQRRSWQPESVESGWLCGERVPTSLRQKKTSNQLLNAPSLQASDSSSPCVNPTGNEKRSDSTWGT